MFRKANPKDKEQFAFDYDGEKIPIISSNNRKGNPIKILKTVYKVHKDKVDTRRLPRRLMRVSDRVSYLRLGPVLNPSSKMAQISTSCAGASSKMFDGLANCNP